MEPGSALYLLNDERNPSSKSSLDTLTRVSSRMATITLPIAGTNMEPTIKISESFIHSQFRHDNATAETIKTLHSLIFVVWDPSVLLKPGPSQPKT